MPGLVNAINPNMTIGTGLTHLYDVTWLFGIFTAALLYTLFSKFFPDPESHISHPVYADDQPVLSPNGSAVSYNPEKGEFEGDNNSEDLGDEKKTNDEFSRTRVVDAEDF